MPLAAGVAGLTSSITASWSNTSQGQSPPNAATELSNAAMQFAMTGVPMTNITGLQAPGQPVAGAVTVSPGIVTGNGIGGIDVPSPGMGLDAAKATLIAELTANWSNTSQGQLAPTSAQKTANAILAFLSQAKVLTIDNGIAAPGQSTPPPAGPVSPGPWLGSGIGGIESTNGIGLPAGLSACIGSISGAWADVTQANSPAKAAQKVADALCTFFKTAMVTTIDTGISGGGAAAVATPPLPPVGATVGPSIATGNGTGSIA